MTRPKVRVHPAFDTSPSTLLGKRWAALAPEVIADLRYRAETIAHEVTGGDVDHEWLLSESQIMGWVVFDAVNMETPTIVFRQPEAALEAMLGLVGLDVRLPIRFDVSVRDF